MIIIYFIKSLIFNIIAYFSVSIIFVFSIVFSRISTKLTFKIVKLYCYTIHFLFYKIIGVKFEIRGVEKVKHLANKPCIIASSHQSIWETMFIFNKVFTSPKYVLKKEILQITMVGKLIKKHIGIAINRKNVKQASKSILESSQVLFQNNEQLIIFPEGTRVTPGKTVTWKKSFAKIYEQNNVPIVPVALNSGYFWAKKSFIKYPGKIIVEFLDPINKGLTQTEVMNKVPLLVQQKSLELAKEGACKYIAKKYLP